MARDWFEVYINLNQPTGVRDGFTACTYNLYRQAHRLEHATWEIFPPQVLHRSNSRIAVFSRKSKSDSECKLSLSYGLVCRQWLLAAKLEVSIGSKYNSLGTSVSLSQDPFLLARLCERETDIPPVVECTRVFKTDVNHEDRYRMIQTPNEKVYLTKIVWSISLTEFGLNYLQESLTELSMRLERCFADWTTKLACPPKGISKKPSTVSRRVLNIEDANSHFFLPGAPDSDGMLLDEERNIYDNLALAIRHTPPQIVHQILLASAFPKLPKSFLTRSVNPGWKERLRKNKFSLFIRIVNLSRYPLFFLSRQVRRRLTDCHLIEFPKDKIEPNNYTEFGVYSSNVLRTYQGAFEYEVLGMQDPERLVCVFGFEFHVSPNPKVKPKTSIHRPQDALRPQESNHSGKMSDEDSARVRTHTLKIESSMENVNEATLIFRVIDTAWLPFCSLQACWVSTVIPSAVGIPPSCGHSEAQNAMAAYRSSICSKGQAILTVLHKQLVSQFDDGLCQAVGERGGEVNGIVVSGDVWWWTERLMQPTNQIVKIPFFRKANLPSPRQLLKDTNVPGSKSVYLEYNIGPEIFRMHSDSSTGIELNTLYPGGIAGLERTAPILMTAESTAKLSSVLCSLVDGMIRKFQKQLNDGKLPGIPALQASFTAIKREFREEAEVEIAFETIKLFETVMDEYLEATKRDQEAASIVEKCHRWGVLGSSKYQTDAQGILFYIAHEWSEFSDLFCSRSSGALADNLVPIKELSARWTTQDLENITTETIAGALRTVKLLAEEIQNLEAIQKAALLRDRLAEVTEINSTYSGTGNYVLNPDSHADEETPRVDVPRTPELVLTMSPTETSS